MKTDDYQRDKDSHTQRDRQSNKVHQKRPTSTGKQKRATKP